MATPAYQGANQPPADNGGSWFGRLGSFFGGGGTPSYAGLGQPNGSVGALGSAPAYAPAPVVTPPKDAQASQPGQAVQTDPMGTNAALAPRACPLDPVCCPIDPAAIAAGQIAIVIPRERFACAEVAIRADGRVAPLRVTD